MPLFTLKNVEPEKSSLGVKNLIKSTKKLVVKSKPTNPLQEKGTLRILLKSRFNEVFVNKKGEEYPYECKYGCDWCRRSFDHSPMGIPLKYTRLINGEGFYKMDGWLCSFECSLAFVRNENLKSTSNADSLYRESEHLLFSLYNKLYPDGAGLKPAPDWRLFRDNGGDLDDQDLTSAKQHTYFRTANIKIAPMCVVYQS